MPPATSHSLNERLLSAERLCGQLRHALREHEQLLSMAAHELRTPLAALNATCEVLQHLCHDDPNTAVAMIHDLKEEVAELGRIVDDVLVATRTDWQGMSPSWTSFSIKTVCDSIARLLRHVIERQPITFVLQIDPPDLSMVGDATAVRRMLINLVGNALRHTRAGRIGISVSRHAAFIRVVVSDTGAGMTRSRLQQLRTHLQHGSSAVPSREGLGLGMHMCQAIAALHDGTLNITSVAGCGTEVTVEMRADLPPTPATVRQRQSA